MIWDIQTHTHTITYCIHIISKTRQSQGKVKNKELIKTFFFKLEALKCPRSRNKG